MILKNFLPNKKVIFFSLATFQDVIFTFCDAVLGKMHRGRQGRVGECHLAIYLKYPDVNPDK